MGLPSAVLTVLAGVAAPPAPAGAFAPPAEFRGKFGDYRPLLTFDDGTPVRTAADWPRRRKEILDHWTVEMGPWPPRVESPRVVYRDKTRHDGYTAQPVHVEAAPGRMNTGAVLLTPDGPGPFPAVVCVYYESATLVGANDKQHRDFARQLAKRGFVTLALGPASGGSSGNYYPSKERCQLQPLSYLAYQASNARAALSRMPTVDPRRVGVTGHSYGGKWAMFASCLDDGFAAAAWSDGGVVFDETRSNVNFWEPWYLGFDPVVERPRGTIAPDRPRTGAYKRLVEQGRDLHEVMALMAPRPFLVSGGSEDPPKRWVALNHVVAVNDLLGAKDRVAMTNRPAHGPTEESNAALVGFFESALK